MKKRILNTGLASIYLVSLITPISPDPSLGRYTPPPASLVPAMPVPARPKVKRAVVRVQPGPERAQERRPVVGSVPDPAHPNRIVSYQLEWGTSAGQSYSVVFSGVVSCKGRPCPNARVQLVLLTPANDELTSSTTSGDDGSYSLQVTMPGRPNQAADWKLTALASIARQDDPTEIDGRTIFTDNQTTVAIYRPIQLIQG